MSEQLKFLIEKYNTTWIIQPIIVDDNTVVDIINQLYWTDFRYIDELNWEIIEWVSIFETNEKNFKIEQTREIIEKASIKSYNWRSIFILKEIDKLTLQAANSLLKILEDVPKWLFFILTTSSIENIIETIRSRVIYFWKNYNNTELSDEIKNIIDDFLYWNKDLLYKLSHKWQLEKNEVMAILEYIFNKIKDKKEYYKIYKIINDSLLKINSSNVNPKYVLDRVILMF